MTGLAAIADSASAQSGATSEGPPAPFASAVLERDLPRLVEMFAGEWDNAEQVGFSSELGYPAPPTRRHITVRRIEAPGIGPLVLRLDEYQDNDPAKLGRQRLYAFAVDTAERAIRMDVLTPPLGAKLTAESDSATLTREGLRFNPGCETWWRASADQFVGWMKDGACRIAVPDDAGRSLAIDAEIVLSADQLWMSESVRDGADRNAVSDDPAIPVQYRRATAFTCWLAVPRLAPQQGWFYARDLAIHDQGGEVWITTDETTPRTFGLRMRTVRWPTGPNADALTLYVHDERDAAAAAIGYAWANPDATRVGINLRSVQGSCSR